MKPPTVKQLVPSFYSFAFVTALLPASVAFSACGNSEPTEPRDDASPAGGGGETMGSAGAASFDPSPCPDSPLGFATEVVSFEFGEGASFGRENFPEAVLHGPEGGGCCQGSLQVVSLGDGGEVVLGFGERKIVDGPGADFAIFENAFHAGDEEGEIFAEPGSIAVSGDGEEWIEFPCDPKEYAATHCAGIAPVLANVVSGEGDAFDATKSGGDLFDLSDVGLSEARYVRVTDFAGDDAVFDLDAAAIFHGQCEE